MHRAPTRCGAADPPCIHSDPLAPYSKHRRYNSPVCRSLAMDGESLDLAKAIGNCATSLGFDLELDGDQGPVAHLRAMGACNRRLCPFCEWRRSKAWRRRFFQGLPQFHEDFPTHKPVFLTLTVRNCPVTELRETIAHMHASWKRMTLCAFFPTKFWFRRTEITQQGGEIPGSVGVHMHPHIHALLFVPAGYFSHGYVRQTEWQRQWQMAARLDYTPVVDVRRARTRAHTPAEPLAESRVAALEVAKYSTKATDLLSMGSALGEYNRQVKGLRLSASSGSLRPYISDASIANDELVDNGTVAIAPTVRAQALWFEDVGEYLFSDVT